MNGSQHNLMRQEDILDCGKDRTSDELRKEQLQSKNGSQPKWYARAELHDFVKIDCASRGGLEVEHDIVKVWMPGVTTIKTVLLRPMQCTWLSLWGKSVGAPVWLITQPVLDDVVVCLRMLTHVTCASVSIELASATFKPVAEVASAAIAETVSVVGRSAVGNSFGGASVGVAKVMSLLNVSAY